ncbi:ABC-2 transporter permease [Clostridium oryzae]|uniref:ABC-2 family transporter protein n=1 Tax=Clostridium oryzae TaxID=1450648 RepID=A0A1V4ICZ6_9CLOT|nr:ABC-2 transporter permease [Clostridium oryzae]OPJ57724.1 ABC-2 family transporter protein [Clostridium oryzae]
MLGLMLKDLINLKKQFKIILIILIFYTVWAITSKGTAMFNTMLALIFAFMPITALSYDERADWDKYVLSMPVSRTDIVTSKYILGITFIFITLILNIIINSFVGPNKIENTIIVPVTIASGLTTLLAVMFPILFKYGVEKSRTIFFLLFLLPFASGLIFSKLNIKMPSEQTVKTILISFPFVALALYVISVAISLTIYDKKEL